MVLQALKVINGDKNIVDCEFYNKNKVSPNENYNTLILGENGAGKSFVFRMITDIFMYLEKALNQTRKPKFMYEKFYVKYRINGNIYEIHRESPRELIAYKNQEEISYKEIELPERILAVSFMVNDKFMSTKDMSTGYRYLGVRSSSNSTFTSSILKKVYSNLLNVLLNNRQKELSNILKMIGFEDSYFKIKFYYGEEVIYHINKDYSNENIKEEAYFTELYFVKNGKEVSFETCSSGEKHILFAFIGILGQINDNSIILIDEPEISLHPEWQIRYMSKIESVFNKISSCHFLLASHSHFFVSDLPPQKSSLVIFKRNNEVFDSELLPYETSAWSAENVIYNVFGLRTTRNYYFEQDLLMLMQLMKNSEIEQNKLVEYINKLKKYVLSGNDPLYDLIKEAEELIHV